MCVCVCVCASFYDVIVDGGGPSGGPSPGQGAAAGGEGVKSPSPVESSISPDLSRVEDLASFFKMGPGGFSRNPETFAFIQLQKHLSNIKWVCERELGSL